jgi:hypothetical protein
VGCFYDYVDVISQYEAKYLKRVLISVLVGMNRLQWSLLCSC